MSSEWPRPEDPPVQERPTGCLGLLLALMVSVILWWIVFVLVTAAL